MCCFLQQVKKDEGRDVTKIGKSDRVLRKRTVSQQKQKTTGTTPDLLSPLLDSLSSQITKCDLLYYLKLILMYVYVPANPSPFYQYLLLSACG